MGESLTLLAAPGSALEARLYTAIHRGVPGDVERYRAACRGARRVLELGCGDGRVLGALAHAPNSGPRRLVGVDCHPGMLELARQRCSTATWLRADMADFELGERFDRILIPFSGLWCLSDSEKVACLLRVTKHLDTSGMLCFDVYDTSELRAGPHDAAEDDGEASDDPGVADGVLVDGPEFLVRIEVGGVRYDVFEQNRYDFAARHISARFDYRAQVASESRLVSRQLIEHHYVSDGDLTALLHAAGLQRLDRPRSAFSGTNAPDGQLYVAAVHHASAGQTPPPESG